MVTAKLELVPKLKNFVATLVESAFSNKGSHKGFGAEVLYLGGAASLPVIPGPPTAPELTPVVPRPGP